MNTTEFQNLLNKYDYLKQDLFIRGFLVTDKDFDDLSGFPFYGNWKTEKHCGYNFLAHRLVGMHVYERDGDCYFILGHAYNPFTMEIDEIEILKRIAEAYGTKNYIDRINEITGVFVYGSIVDGVVEYFADP